MATARFLVPLLFFLIQAADQAADRWPKLYSQALEQYNRGNFNVALADAAPAYQTWKGSPQSQWHWPFRLLLAESLSEGDQTAEALPLLNKKAPTPAWEARRLVDLAFIRFRNRQDDETRRLLDAGAAINPKDAPDVAAKIELIRGNLLYDDPAQAEACFRRALAWAPRDSLLESYALTDLGLLDLDAYRNDESTVWLLRSRELAERIGTKRGVALADSNLGLAYRRLGEPDVATKYLDEAALIAEKLGDRVNLLRVLIHSGETALDLGQDATAKNDLEKALRMVAPDKDHDWTASALVDFSMLALAKRDIHGAAELNRAAGEVASKTTDKYCQLIQRIQAAEIASAQREYADGSVLFARALVQAREQKDPIGEWQCEAGLASIHRAERQNDEAERDYRLAIATIENERSRLQHDDFKFSFVSHLISFYREYVDFLMERGDVKGAFRVSQSSRGRLLAEKVNGAGAPESPLDVAALQRALRSSNSVLLSYWLAPSRSLVWVLDGEHLDALQLPPEAEISARVQQYSDAIQRGANLIDAQDSPARWLFAHLIPKQYQNRNGIKAIVQLDGSLHQLNFESLPVGDSGRYWIQDATISIAPSLALLRESANAPQRRLLMFGDPNMANDLSRLPYLKDELDSVAKHYDEKQVFTAADATPAAYLNAHAETYSTLHFASHAVGNRESPLDSAVILAGTPENRKLYARDVLRHPLTADLVTLSACETAGNRAYYGEGLIGLSWAFLSAGARNVVAGLWQVDDRATGRLMDRFYEAIASNRSPASALRQAKLDLMESTPVYRKPRYWAAFETFTRALYP